MVSKYCVYCLSEIGINHGNGYYCIHSREYCSLQCYYDYFEHRNAYKTEAISNQLKIKKVKRKKRRGRAR